MESQKNIIDVEEIQTLIPHRYPMLLVDRVLDYVPGKSLHAIKNVTFNEPVFTGHFPELAIFPGVMILEALAQATGILGFKTTEGREKDEMYLFASIDNAKFKQPVVPVIQCTYMLTLLKSVAVCGNFMVKLKLTVKLYVLQTLCVQDVSYSK